METVLDLGIFDALGCVLLFVSFSILDFQLFSQATGPAVSKGVGSFNISGTRDRTARAKDAVYVLRRDENILKETFQAFNF